MKLPNGIYYDYATRSGKAGMIADLHCHNRFELIYVCSGELAHVIEGRRYLLKAGDLVLVRPSRYHYLQLMSDMPYVRFNILFDPVLCGIGEALQLPRTTEVVSLSANAIATGIFEKLELYRRGLNDEKFARVLQLLLSELFLNLQLHPGGAQKQQPQSPQLLAQALDYINQNLYTITDLEQVARALYISPSYLYQLFRRGLHQTPGRYIADKRLLAAQRRLRAGGRPSAVYRECGFRDYTSFFRSYKAFFGHPPSVDSSHRDHKAIIE